MTGAGSGHPLTAVLGVAVTATLAGAANCRELESVVADLPHGYYDCWCPLASDRRPVPSAQPGHATAGPDRARRRPLDQTVGAWLRQTRACHTHGWAIALDGKDLRGSSNAHGRLVLFSAMTHRHAPHTSVLVLGQITVSATTTETT